MYIKTNNVLKVVEYLNLFNIVHAVSKEVTSIIEIDTNENLNTFMVCLSTIDLNFTLVNIKLDYTHVSIQFSL